MPNIKSQPRFQVVAWQPSGMSVLKKIIYMHAVELSRNKVKTGNILAEILIVMLILIKHQGT